MALARTTPLKRKRSTPRRLPGLHCSGRTKAGTACTLPIRFEKWCHRHAIKEADRLFSIWIRKVRDRKCEICGTDADLQAAHRIGRGYFAVRFEPLNLTALCKGDHKDMTHRPLEWEDHCREVLGTEVYDALRLRAVRGGMPDVGYTILQTRGWLEEAGVAA